MLYVVIVLLVFDINNYHLPNQADIKCGELLINMNTNI